MSAFSGGWTSIVSRCKDNLERMSHGEEGKGRRASALKYGMGIVGRSTRHLRFWNCSKNPLTLVQNWHIPGRSTCKIGGVSNLRFFLCHFWALFSSSSLCWCGQRVGPMIADRLCHWGVTPMICCIVPVPYRRKYVWHYQHIWEALPKAQSLQCGNGWCC